MKPRVFVQLLLSVTSITAAVFLFLNNPAKSSSKRAIALPSVTFQWGEGSETGQPETKSHP